MIEKLLSIYKKMSHGDHCRTENLLALCDRLKSERLLVTSEQNALQNLNSKVENEFLELYKLVWICRHERVSYYLFHYFASFL